MRIHRGLSQVQIKTRYNRNQVEDTHQSNQYWIHSPWTLWRFVWRMDDTRDTARGKDWWDARGSCNGAPKKESRTFWGFMALLGQGSPSASESDISFPVKKTDEHGWTIWNTLKSSFKQNHINQTASWELLGGTEFVECFPSNNWGCIQSYTAAQFVTHILEEVCCLPSHQKR